MNYYNENEPKTAAWLRRLIAEGLIPDGAVDERSIEDVQGRDLQGYAQCHFFAGIGGWSEALRLAEWPEDRPVWTGSCPCPPFSCAGKKKSCPRCSETNALPHPGRTGVFVCCECGHEWLADGRHLWPDFHRLIGERRPPVVFGEQVASPDGRVWLAGVQATLEVLGYAVGRADLCAAGVGAPHIRQRLWWVADAGRAERGRRTQRQRKRRRVLHAPDRRGPGGLGDAEGERHAGSEHAGASCEEESGGTRMLGTGGPGEAGGVGEPGAERSQGEQPAGAEAATAVGTRVAGRGFWSRSELIDFSDGKARRIEPGTAPLVDGFPGRVELLRGYGNAIVPHVAARFIAAAEEVIAGRRS